MRSHVSSYLILFILSVVILPAQASAQAISLAPGQVIKTFTPGVPFEFELATVNNADTPIEMSVQITDLWYNEKNEKTFAAPGTSPNSAANWIQFVPERFSVAPHQTQKMKAIVTPPADAKGGYYATLFVQSKPQLSFDKAKDGKAIFTNMRLGCLVLLTAEKTELYKVDVQNVKLSPPSENKSLELTFDVANGSNAHIFAHPRVAILDSNQKLVAKAESSPKRFFPKQNDSMRVTWAGSLPAASYTAVLTVSYGDNEILTQQIPFDVTDQLLK